MSKFFNEMSEFAKQNVAPFSDEVDQKGIFPRKAFENIKKAGLMSLILPEEYGGMGKGIVEHTEICMALGKVCGSTGLSYMMHNVCMIALAKYGSRELKDIILPRIVNENAMLSFAASETGSGTHFDITATKGIAEGNKVVINGQKSFVTSAGYADYYLVTTSTETAGVNKNWLVPKETKGIEFLESDWDGFGMRGNASCPMNLVNAEVDTVYQLSEPELTPEVMLTTITPFFTVGLAAVYAGILSHVLETAVGHTKGRMYPDGKPISTIPVVQNHLADIFVKEQAAKTMVLSAASDWEKSPQTGLPKIIAARIFAMESAVSAATTGMELGGGIAYAKRTPMERLLRDALAGQVMAPSKDGLYSTLGSILTK